MSQYTVRSITLVEPESYPHCLSQFHERFCLGEAISSSRFLHLSEQSPKNPILAQLFTAVLDVEIEPEIWFSEPTPYLERAADRNEASSVVTKRGSSCSGIPK